MALPAPMGPPSLRALPSAPRLFAFCVSPLQICKQSPLVALALPLNWTKHIIGLWPSCWWAGLGQVLTQANQTCLELEWFHGSERICQNKLLFLVSSSLCTRMLGLYFMDLMISFVFRSFQISLMELKKNVYCLLWMASPTARGKSR